MENIKLIRHLEEEQDFARNNRNGHVLESEYYKIPIFSQSIRSTLDSVSKKTVKLITSSQNRSMETAELVSKSLIKDSINTSEIQIDPRSGPLKHGEYSICSDGETIDENSKISKIAQKAYVHETIHRRNIFYRH
jgi:broad specificity phosphatase PhoE